MSGELSVDISQFTSKTRLLLKQADVDQDVWLDEQMGLLTRDVSVFTPPFGGGDLPSMGRRAYGTGKDKIAGENAIRTDLELIFRRRERGYLEAVEDITGTRENVRQVLRNKKGVPYLIDVDVINYDSVPDAMAWHKKLRRADGRVKGKMYSGGNDSKIGRWQARDRMWITPEIYAELTKALFKRVGQGKALFAWVALQFGGPPAQRWISRHFYRYRASIRRGKDFRSATASSGQLVHTVRFLPRIQKNRAIRAEKRLGYLTRQSIKKAGLAA